MELNLTIVSDRLIYILGVERNKIEKKSHSERSKLMLFAIKYHTLSIVSKLRKRTIPIYIILREKWPKKSFRRKVLIYSNVSNKGKNNSKKSFKNVWRLKNMYYLCTRNQEIQRMTWKHKGSLKRWWKKVHQKFGGLKNLSYLCNRFRLLNWRDDAKGS